MNPPKSIQSVDLPDSAVDARLLRHLFEQGRSTLPSAFLAGVLVAGIFYALTSSSRCLIWMAILQGTQALRWHWMRENNRLYPAAQYPLGQPEGAWRYALPLAGSAVVWGAAPWMLLPMPASTEQSAVLTVFMFGMMAGSVPAIAPWRTLIPVWLLPLIVGMVTRFAWQGDRMGIILAVASVLFGGTMIMFARTQHRMHRATTRAVLQKEALSDLVLSQSTELQRLSQERTRFFAAANHDLRQPVHALALLSATLQRDLQGHALQPVAERVVQATSAVGHMLNSMLDISRIDAGAVQPRLQPVSVQALFLRAMGIFEAQAEPLGLSLRFRGGPCWVRSDEELLFRVLCNLIDNALKHTASGGVLVTAQRRGESVRLAVWDTGRGIAPEHLPRLCDEFYQVDNPQRDRARGLGIGLAIVKRLTGLLGATLDLKSTPGRGSVFWVNIPRAHPVEAPSATAGRVSAEKPPSATSPTWAPPPWPMACDPASPHPAPQASMPQHLLVLDDEAPIGEALRSWLTPHCAQVHITQRLEQALAVVHTQGTPIDLLVVDYRLADTVDGIEATRLLRQAAGRSIPALLFTGDTDPERVRLAYRSGLHVLFKPVQPEQMMRAMVAAFNQHELGVLPDGRSRPPSP